MSEFRRELSTAINRSSKENGSDTPDFILAEFLGDCLTAFDKAVLAREKWYGRETKFVPYYECPKDSRPASNEAAQATGPSTYGCQQSGPGPRIGTVGLCPHCERPLTPEHAPPLQSSPADLPTRNYDEFIKLRHKT